MMSLVSSPARLAPVVLLSVLAMPPDAEAQDYKPSALNVVPNAKHELGQIFSVKMATPPRGINIGCDIVKDETWQQHHHPANAQHECTVDGFEESTNGYTPGPALLVMRAFAGQTKLVGETTIPIQLVAAVPRGGAGKAFDSGYWMNKSLNKGALKPKEVVVKNGILGFRLYVGDNISFAPTTGIILNKDGMIVRQTVALDMWTAKPGQEIDDEERDEANATKTVTVFGKFRTLAAGRALELHVEGPRMREDSNPLTYEGLLFRNSEEGESMVFGGGGGSRSGGSGGACKKACFHGEATCSGSRGACMKARQQCVKACR